MPFNARTISVHVAVVCFFVVGVATSLIGLSPFVCCKRACLGAAAAGIASSLVIRAVNAIVISAMVETQMREQRELYGDNKG